MKKVYGEEVLGKHVLHRRDWNGNQTPRSGEICEYKVTLTNKKTRDYKYKVDFGSNVFEWLDLPLEEQNGNIVWLEEKPPAPVSSPSGTRRAPVIKIEGCTKDFAQVVPVITQKLAKKKQRQSAGVSIPAVPWASNSARPIITAPCEVRTIAKKKHRSGPSNLVSNSVGRPVIPDMTHSTTIAIVQSTQRNEFNDQNVQNTKRDDGLTGSDTASKALERPKKKQRTYTPYNQNSSHTITCLSNGPANVTASTPKKLKKKQIGALTKNARARAKEAKSVNQAGLPCSEHLDVVDTRPSTSIVVKTTSNPAFVAPTSAPKPNNRPQNNGWPEDWLEGIERFLYSEVSQENVKRCMPKIKALASGKGISYKNWKANEIFYKDRKVDLSFDLDQMMKDAKKFEEKHGEDKGHGWVLTHPIKKMQLYKQHLASSNHYLG